MPIPNYPQKYRGVIDKAIFLKVWTRERINAHKADMSLAKGERISYTDVIDTLLDHYEKDHGMDYTHPYYHHRRDSK